MEGNSVDIVLRFIALGPPPTLGKWLISDVFSYFLANFLERFAKFYDYERSCAVSDRKVNIGEVTRMSET